MKLQEAIEICKKANEWRRYEWEIWEWPKMPHPKEFWIAIDILIKYAEWNIEEQTI